MEPKKSGFDFFPLTTPEENILASYRPASNNKRQVDKTKTQNTDAYGSNMEEPTTTGFNLSYIPPTTPKAGNFLASYEPATAVTSNNERQVDKKDKSTGKLQCFFLFFVGLIAFLALCAGVAALVVVYPNASSTVSSDIQDLRNEIAELRAEVEGPTTQPPPTLPPSIGTFENPANSCIAISILPSGNYWINTTSTSEPAQVYCEMDQTTCSCTTSTNGWMRIANLNMIDPEQDCPSGFSLIEIMISTETVRFCNKDSTGCTSKMFPTHGVEYSHICGRIIGYRVGLADGFHENTGGIDTNYVDGVSLTYGSSPREHIWTFSSNHESPHADQSFIGSDYFCGNPPNNGIMWSDSKGCMAGVSDDCCTRNNPPVFCRELNQPSSEDIEFRLCEDDLNESENIAFSFIQIYVR